jgi:uncharacterized protein with PQ loop repeat
MGIIKKTIEGIFGFAIFANALLFSLQAIKIFRKKTSAGISLFTFLGFMLIQLSIASHGIVIRDYLLASGFTLNAICCGAVVIMALIYR